MKTALKHSLQWIIALALAALIPIAIIGSFGIPYQVKGPLHLTGVEIGDIVWIKTSTSWFEHCKAALKWPQATESIDKELLSNLKRGDVVAYTIPMSDSRSTEELSLGRIAGLPGDTVKINNGNIFVNGHRLKQVYAIHLFTVSFADSANAIQRLQSPEIIIHSLPSKNKRLYELSFSATEKTALAVAGDSAVLGFSKLVKTTDVGLLFPNGNDHQTGYFYGPIEMPVEGDSLWSKSTTYHTNLFQKFEEMDQNQAAIFSESYYFLINDYRMETDDSREYGALPAKQIRGIVTGLAWQPN